MMASSEAEAPRCASGAFTSLGVGNGLGADKGLSSSTGDWDIVPSSPWTLVSLPKSTSSSIPRNELRFDLLDGDAMRALCVTVRFTASRESQ